MTEIHPLKNQAFRLTVAADQVNVEVRHSLSFGFVLDDGLAILIDRVINEDAAVLDRLIRTGGAVGGFDLDGGRLGCFHSNV